MKIDVAARQRIINERGQKNLINQLVSSLKPPEKPDTVTEPINKIVDGVNRGANISTVLVAFIQNVLKEIKDIGSKSPSSSDVKEVTTTIKDITFPKTVILNSKQQKELVSIGKDIKNALELHVASSEISVDKNGRDLSVSKEDNLKTDDPKLYTAINSLNENIIALTTVIKRMHNSNGGGGSS